MFFYFSGSQDGTVLFSGPGGLVAVARRSHGDLEFISWEMKPGVIDVLDILGYPGNVEIYTYYILLP